MCTFRRRFGCGAPFLPQLVVFLSTATVELPQLIRLGSPSHRCVAATPFESTTAFRFSIVVVCCVRSEMKVRVCCVRSEMKARGDFRAMTTRAPETFIRTRTQHPIRHSKTSLSARQAPRSPKCRLSPWKIQCYTPSPRASRHVQACRICALDHARSMSVGTISALVSTDMPRTWSSAQIAQ